MKGCHFSDQGQDLRTDVVELHDYVGANSMLDSDAFLWLTEIKLAECRSKRRQRSDRQHSWITGKWTGEEGAFF
jgi:hypothetical protein